MPTLDDVSRVAAQLPGSEERTMTGGLAWFVRNKLYAWECYPWPSESPALRELIAAEPVVGVKVADSDEQRAFLQGWPDAFRASEVSWGGPKVLFRLGKIDLDLLAEVVTEAWRSQAPKYLRREFDDRFESSS
ncbi:hypothetical protein ACX3O0_13880 [Homoserinimonas sp. A447]